jgi:selenocysteine lyase/cysteine desulfurase
MENVKYNFRPFVTNDSPFSQISKNIIGINKKNYFDYTASGLAYKPIEKRITEVLKTYANTHSEFASDSRRTANYYDIARDRLKTYLCLKNDFVLLPCGTGATGAIKKFQELLGIYLPPATKSRLKLNYENIKKPLVIVGPFEHHSNEISYREALCDIKRVPLCKNGNVDLIYLENILKENKNRQIIGSFSVASNVTGILAPYEAISKLLRKYDGIVAFDNAAASPCLNIDSVLYDAMFLSPHKLIGGPGTCGLLAIRIKLINAKEPPTFAGGGTVAYVSADEHIYNTDIQTREDAGTPAILQLIKASFVYQLRDEIGLERIRNRKQKLLKMIKIGLEKLDGYTVYGEIEKNENIGILAVNFKGITPYELCEKLSSDFGIQTRAGCSCAGPYGHDLLGITQINMEKEKPGWLRISVNYTHTAKSINHLLFALKECMLELKK